MQWSAQVNAGFSAAPVDALYLPVDARPDAPCVADQLGRDGSLLETVRKLIALRKTHPALGADGDFAPRYAETNRYPFIYERSSGNERIVVALNPAAQPVAVDLAAGSATRCEPLLARGAELTPRGDTLHLEMAGVSYGIFAVGPV
jgi:maltose alpha-D-glucosyltransferase/alpha-amylase